MKLSKLAEKTRTVQVQFEGETADVVYRVAELTPAFTEWLQEEGLTRRGSLYEALEKLVISWDIVDDNDQQLAVTVEGMKPIPSALLRAILYAVTRDGQRVGEPIAAS